MTDHFAKLIAERLSGMPEASRSVFAALVSAGHRVLLDSWRPDLTPAQRDADNAQFINSLAEALDAVPGARAPDSDGLRDWPSTLH
jgi:hypothetical protein